MASSSQKGDGRSDAASSDDRYCRTDTPESEPTATSMTVHEAEEELGKIVVSRLTTANKRGPCVWDKTISRTERFNANLRDLVEKVVSEEETIAVTQIIEEVDGQLELLYSLQELYAVDYDRHVHAQDVCVAKGLCTSIATTVKDTIVTAKEAGEWREQLNLCKRTIYEYAMRGDHGLYKGEGRTIHVLGGTASGVLSVKDVNLKVQTVQANAMACCANIATTTRDLDDILARMRHNMLGSLTHMAQCTPEILAEFEAGENPMGAWPLPVDYRDYFGLPSYQFCRYAFSYLGKHCLQKLLLNADTLLNFVQDKKELTDESLLRLVLGAYVHFMGRRHQVKCRKLKPHISDGYYCITDLAQKTQTVRDVGQGPIRAKADLLWQMLINDYYFVDAALSSLTGIRFSEEVSHPPGGCQPVLFHWPDEGVIMAYCDDIAHVLHRHMGFADRGTSERRHTAVRKLKKRQAVIYNDGTNLTPHAAVISLLNECLGKGPLKSYSYGPSAVGAETYVDVGRVIGRACDGKQTAFMCIVANHQHIDRENCTCNCAVVNGWQHSWLRLITMYPVPPPV